MRPHLCKSDILKRCERAVVALEAFEKSRSVQLWGKFGTADTKVLEVMALEQHVSDHSLVQLESCNFKRDQFLAPVFCAAVAVVLVVLLSALGGQTTIVFGLGRCGPALHDKVTHVGTGRQKSADGNPKWK
jgi:hypothetical protein